MSVATPCALASRHPGASRYTVPRSTPRCRPRTRQPPQPAVPRPISTNWPHACVVSRAQPSRARPAPRPSARPALARADQSPVTARISHLPGPRIPCRLRRPLTGRLRCPLKRRLMRPLTGRLRRRLRRRLTGRLRCPLTGRLMRRLSVEPPRTVGIASLPLRPSQVHRFPSRHLRPERTSTFLRADHEEMAVLERCHCAKRDQMTKISAEEGGEGRRRGKSAE